MSHFIYCYDECRYAECRGAKGVSPLRVFQAKLIIVGLTEPLLDKPKKLLAANTLPYLPVISATTKYWYKTDTCG
jgi:hypothetical protein